ncbi:hypothetical protein LZC95_05985 [Pendulispora brunnea]|uniref:PLD phosphodiesterase domain-containing protein n=1 Tax=Pendulispora brunnea TaxID=2905690 RepID=A0ABZ2KCP6_9BACT
MINSTIATTAFNQAGLDAMGAASGQLAAQWAEGAASYDANAMTLTTAGSTRWHAMVGGTLLWRDQGAPELTDSAGNGLTGVVAVLRFHPQAALRLRRLIGQRFDGRSDDRANRPVPFFAAIRGAALPASSEAPLAAHAATTGTALVGGTLTFHDEQGAIVDPVAVACLHRDLMRAFSALRKGDAGPATDLDSGTSSAGGIGAVCALATGVRVAIVDIFGGPWVQRTGRAGLRIGSGGALGGGPHDWPEGTLQATATDPGDLRFGFSPEGTLGMAGLSRPAFPATPFPSGSSAPVLPRQFFRVVAVHTELHLLGNRSADAVDGIPAADEATRLEPGPAVREGDGIELLVDGQATAGAITEAVSGSAFALAASPTLADNVAFPPNRTARWPAVPAVSGTAEDLSAAQSARARNEATAAYAGASPDVVLSWPAGALPIGAHVRAFPRVDPGPAIVPLAELDFARRGDGGATVVTAGATALLLLLRDPYRVGTNPRPAAPRLRFDLLIVSRGPAGVQTRLLGGLEVPVGTGATAPARPPVSNALSAVPLDRRGLAPSPRLGLTPTTPAAGSDPLLAALGEAAPRESPRFRTMARAESVVAAHDGSAWTAVLTPGFLDARVVRGDARLGNPGQDAGPEDHAPGVRATGRLALDLARAALRRTHHLARRLPELDSSRWNAPSAAGTGTLSAAILQNVAETCESPELSVVPESTVHALPSDWNGVVSALGSALPSLPAPAAGDRWVAEVRREAFAAKHGRRDTQWSLRWAIGHARRLVYIETPLFGATADGSSAHEVDLVALLAARLAAARDLRVILAVPKRIPFGPGYESFAQRFHLLRNAALASLQAAAPGRVALYHPVGFPGRPEVIRGTVAVIDDVWALVGSSSVSRRGLTLDGSIDAVLTDRAFHEGASVAIRDLRRRAMARTLSLSAPTGATTANASWVRTRDPRTAFTLVSEILARGGDGLIEPLWSGLPESELPALPRTIADPDGRGFPTILATFADLLATLGPSRV